MDLTANFTLEEFARVSNAPLTQQATRNAKHFATYLLQPGRRALEQEFGEEMGIDVTSFFRLGDDGAHGRAEGVDYTIDEKFYSWERLYWLHRWTATYYPREFGQLILEKPRLWKGERRGHIHATMPGFNGQVGVVLDEPTEGNYVLASITPAAAPLALFVVAWFGWQFAKKRKAGRNGRRKT